MQLDHSPLQKAREYAGVSDSVGAVELLEILRETRVSKHPDRFQAPAAKAKAEEEFKSIQELITNLDRLVQAEEAEAKPKDLVVYKPSYQLAASQRKVDSLKEERQRLTEDNKYLTEQVEHLEKQLVEKIDAKLIEQQERLRDLYKPKGKDYLTAGVLVALAAVIPIFSKIEEVSTFIARHSPFPPSYIDKTVFFALVLVLIMALKSLFEAHFVSNRADTVLSPTFSRKFIRSIEITRSIEDPKPAKKGLFFLESEVYSFIEKQPSPFWRLLRRFGFRAVSAQANTKLTGLFINMLLEKRLISISYATNLDRKFDVSSGVIYF